MLRQPVLEGLAWLTHWFYLPLALAIPTPMMLVSFLLKVSNEDYHSSDIWIRFDKLRITKKLRCTLSWTFSTNFGSTPSWWERSANSAPHSQPKGWRLGCPWSCLQPSLTPQGSPRCQQVFEFFSLSKINTWRGVNPGTAWTRTMEASCRFGTGFLAHSRTKCKGANVHFICMCKQFNLFILA